MDMKRINKLIKIMLDLANKAEENEETPFDVDGLGCLAFAGYVRNGVKDIIDLQAKYSSVVESERLAKFELEENENLIDHIFGSENDISLFSDEEIDKIKSVVKEIEDSWEDE